MAHLSKLYSYMPPANVKCVQQQRCVFECGVIVMTFIGTIPGY